MEQHESNEFYKKYHVLIETVVRRNMKKYYLDFSLYEDYLDETWAVVLRRIVNKFKGGHKRTLANYIASGIDMLFAKWASTNYIGRKYNQRFAVNHNNLVGEDEDYFDTLVDPRWEFPFLRIEINEMLDKLVNNTRGELIIHKRLGLDDDGDSAMSFHDIADENVEITNVRCKTFRAKNARVQQYYKRAMRKLISGLAKNKETETCVA